MNCKCASIRTVRPTHLPVLYYPSPNVAIAKPITISSELSETLSLEEYSLAQSIEESLSPAITPAATPLVSQHTHTKRGRQVRRLSSPAIPGGPGKGSKSQPLKPKTGNFVYISLCATDPSSCAILSIPELCYREMCGNQGNQNHQTGRDA